MYHNRGGVTTGGESAQYGDVSGLDDLFTEQDSVLQGMIAIYSAWIKELPIAGYRLDTVKHVNNEFWQRFIPAMQEQATSSGRKDFFIFGEIYDPDPAFLSEFVHRAKMPSILDFGFQRAARGFATGADSPRKLADFFAKDSYYTTPNANAYGLVTFLSNHDIGRIGHFLAADLPAAQDDELLGEISWRMPCCFLPGASPRCTMGMNKDLPATEAMLTLDRICSARKCRRFADEKRIGGGDGSLPAFNKDHPLFRVIREMISVRQKHAGLSSGVQVVRYAEENPGIFAVSRIDPNQREEILVVFNNSGEKREANIKTFSAPEKLGTSVLFAALRDSPFSGGPDNQLSVQLPPISVVVLRSPRPIEPGTQQLGELRLVANRSSEIDDRWEVRAELAADQIVSIAFGVRAKGEQNYKFLGTADSPPYRVFPSRDTVPNAPTLEFKAVARNLFGQESAAQFEWQRRVPKRPMPKQENPL